MPNTSQKRIRVMVVEDSPQDQFLLRRELKSTTLGDNVLFLSDPRIALDLLQSPGSNEFRDNLLAIFLDVNLPYLSGIDVAKIIRSIEGMEHFPLIIMTCSPPPHIRRSCRDLATTLIEKPVKLASFSHVLAGIFHPPLKLEPAV